MDRDTNPRSYELLKAFEDQTRYGFLINTSFNARGEPIVGTPQGAYRCHMRTGMDFLALGSYLLDKNEQPVSAQEPEWRKDSVLD